MSKTCPDWWWGNSSVAAVPLQEARKQKCFRKLFSCAGQNVEEMLSPPLEINVWFYMKQRHKCPLAVLKSKWCLDEQNQCWPFAEELEAPVQTYCLNQVQLKQKSHHHTTLEITSRNWRTVVRPMESEQSTDQVKRLQEPRRQVLKLLKHLGVPWPQWLWTLLIVKWYAFNASSWQKVVPSKFLEEAISR